jgi:hypothetical protein
MNATLASSSSAKAPWHLWAVGVVSFLWNCMGAFDYASTEFGGPAYLQKAGMSAEEIAYVQGFPAWAIAAWAVGVWFCLIGSVLLLVRSRLALHSFALSLVGVLVTLYFSLVMPHPASFDTTGNRLFDLALVVVTIGLTGYAWAMAKRGVLR